MKRREEGTEGQRAVGRNRVKISSEVSGGQVEEEKDGRALHGEDSSWDRDPTRLC